LPPPPPPPPEFDEVLLTPQAMVNPAKVSRNVIAKNRFIN